MNEATYKTAFRNFLDKYSKDAVEALDRLDIPEDSDYLYFVIYPERFYRELGVEVRTVHVVDTDRGKIDILLRSLFHGVKYQMSGELDPEDFKNSPEERFVLVTETVINWLEMIIKDSSLKKPCFAGEPDSSRLFSFDSESWKEMAFCH